MNLIFETKFNFIRVTHGFDINMWYSVELKEDGTIFIQSTKSRLKHGAVGRVLMPNCLKSVAEKIKQENE